MHSRSPASTVPATAIPMSRASRPRSAAHCQARAGRRRALPPVLHRARPARQSPSAGGIRAPAGALLCGCGRQIGGKGSCFAFARTAAHDGTYNRNELLPAAEVGRELLLALCRDAVVTGALIAFRLFPL